MSEELPTLKDHVELMKKHCALQKSHLELQKKYNRSLEILVFRQDFFGANQNKSSVCGI